MPEGTDPCPPGWRVPPGGEEEKSIWSHFTLDNSTWNGDITLNPANGRTFDLTVIHGGACWYPASGDREHFGFNHMNIFGFIWSANATETGAYDLYAGYAEIVYANGGAGRFAGIPVRCIRE